VIKKKNLTQEDKEAWDSFTKSPSNIYDKEQENKKEISRKNRFKYDLHGFTLEDANKKVKQMILSGVGKKYKEILLVTGKGLHSTTDEDTYVSKDLSKLKFSVPNFINNSNELNKYVISISEASFKDGGAGAILIKLKYL
tara:strand:- start:1027 stop:1446 length:420 start_codon:yes stop_codon:yes gene_type:complete